MQRMIFRPAFRSRAKGISTGSTSRRQEILSCAGGSQKTYVRRLHEVSVRTAGTDPLQIEIEVKGEAFLYNMVRIIAGTLLYVGQGKIPADGIGEVIEKGDRSLAGKTLAAKGLTLEEVYFDEQSARA